MTSGGAASRFVLRARNTTTVRNAVMRIALTWLILIGRALRADGNIALFNLAAQPTIGWRGVVWTLLGLSHRWRWSFQNEMRIFISLSALRERTKLNKQ